MGKTGGGVGSNQYGPKGVSKQQKLAATNPGMVSDFTPPLDPFSEASPKPGGGVGGFSADAVDTASRARETFRDYVESTSDPEPVNGRLSRALQRRWSKSVMEQYRQSAALQGNLGADMGQSPYYLGVEAACVERHEMYREAVTDGHGAAGANLVAHRRMAMGAWQRAEQWHESPQGESARARDDYLTGYARVWAEFARTVPE